MSLSVGTGRTLALLSKQPLAPATKLQPTRRSKGRLGKSGRTIHRPALHCNHIDVHVAIILMSMFYIGVN